MATDLKVISAVIQGTPTIAIGKITLIFDEKFNFRAVAKGSTRYTTGPISEYWTTCTQDEIEEHVADLIIIEVADVLAKEFRDD